ELTGQGLPAEAPEVALPAAAPTTYGYRQTVGDKRTNPFLLDLDDLPEYLKAESGQTIPVPVPAVCNGRIGKAGEVDSWPFIARKGDVFELELRASRLGSPLDGVLTVTDEAGKELARAESQGAGLDPRLAFTVPADGTYRVRVADRFRSRGGLA